MKYKINEKVNEKEITDKLNIEIIRFKRIKGYVLLIYTIALVCGAFEGRNCAIDLCLHTY